MLLEHAGERHLSAVIDRKGDEAATLVAAELLSILISGPSRPAPPELQPLRARFADLFAKAGRDYAARIASPYVEAAGLAGRLLDSAAGERPLHGDLHHDNILSGARGWLVIDPKGVLGDPAFDAANLFYNPLGRTALCLSPDRIAFMAETFAKAVKRSPATILDHAMAYGCLSAAWHAGDGNTADEERELSIAGAIRTVRLSF
jgi:streptomycin 6-kinase